MTTTVTQADIERVRAEAAEQLAQHIIGCERFRGEIKAEMIAIRAHGERNLKLLYLLLAGMLAVAARSFWPTIF